MRRLTPARLTLLMFVVVGVLVAAYIGKQLLAVEDGSSEPATRVIPMAVTDLEPGTRISESHVGEGPVRESNLTRDTLLNTNVIVGRVVKEPIEAASPILSSKLYPVGETPPLKLGQGKRAVSISAADSVALVNGLIKPGQYVDVHLTPENLNDDRMRGGMTLTLFRGVKVISLNRNFTQGELSGLGNTVTLELTPRQANMLILARQRGSIHLTYNPDGHQQAEGETSERQQATLEEILNLEPLPESEPPFIAETYRGTSRSVLRFRNGRPVNRFQTPRNRSQRSSVPDQDSGTSDSPSSDTNNEPREQAESSASPDSSTR